LFFAICPLIINILFIAIIHVTFENIIIGYCIDTSSFSLSSSSISSSFSSSVSSSFHSSFFLFFSFFFILIITIPIIIIIIIIVGLSLLIFVFTNKIKKVLIIRGSSGPKKSAKVAVTFNDKAKPGL
jgi:hypothetical protein